MQQIQLLEIDRQPRTGTLRAVQEVAHDMRLCDDLPGGCYYCLRDEDMRADAELDEEADDDA